ncbi:MAG TPA: DUF983 domain-containing protein [Rubellimicrobium sp.]|jgi:uncharacterized protein (DUF983 family)|nr:DUF983 domain-containing protein [Rubellimicrobium sp.]
MDDHARAAPSSAELAISPAEALGEDRLVWPAVRRGLMRRCPNCGEGHLFEGYLKVTDTCPACGEVLRFHRADDGPAYLTILVVGHILAVMMHFIWVTFRPEPLVFATMLTVVAVGMSLWLLPRFKGAIVGYQWAHRMHGFGDEA